MRPLSVHAKPLLLPTMQDMVQTKGMSMYKFAVLQPCWTTHYLLVIVWKRLYTRWSTSNLVNAIGYQRLCASLQVEFNKAALSLSDSIPGEQKKAALNRLLKVGTSCKGLSTPRFGGFSCSMHQPVSCQTFPSAGQSQLRATLGIVQSHAANT